MLTLKRKLSRTGGSIDLRLPPFWLEKNKLGINSEVLLEVNEDSIVVRSIGDEVIAGH